MTLLRGPARGSVDLEPARRRGARRDRAAGAGHEPVDEGQAHPAAHGAPGLLRGVAVDEDVSRAVGRDARAGVVPVGTMPSSQPSETATTRRGMRARRPGVVGHGVDGVVDEVAEHGHDAAGRSVARPRAGSPGRADDDVALRGDGRLGQQQRRDDGRSDACPDSSLARAVSRWSSAA